MSSPVVTLFDDVGDAHLYKNVSARLPAFLAEYPPKEGYRIETEVTDSLSLQKGRLALLREAVAGGKRPRSTWPRAALLAVVLGATLGGDRVAATEPEPASMSARLTHRRVVPYPFDVVWPMLST